MLSAAGAPGLCTPQCLQCTAIKRAEGHGWVLLSAPLSLWFCRTIILPAAFFPPTSMLLQQTYRGCRAKTYARRRARQWRSAPAVPTGSHILSGAFGAVPFAIGEVSGRAGLGSGNVGLAHKPGHPQTWCWSWERQVGTSIARKADGCGGLGSELP